MHVFKLSFIQLYFDYLFECLCLLLKAEVLKGRDNMLFILLLLTFTTLPGNGCCLMEERERLEGCLTGSLLNGLQGQGRDLAFVSAIDGD